MRARISTSSVHCGHCGHVICSGQKCTSTCSDSCTHVGPPLMLETCDIRFKDVISLALYPNSTEGNTRISLGKIT